MKFWICFWIKYLKPKNEKNNPNYILTKKKKKNEERKKERGLTTKNGSYIRFIQELLSVSNFSFYSFTSQFQISLFLIHFHIQKNPQCLRISCKQSYIYIYIYFIYTYMHQAFSLSLCRASFHGGSPLYSQTHLFLFIFIIIFFFFCTVLHVSPRLAPHTSLLHPRWLRFHSPMAGRTQRPRDPLVSGPPWVPRNGHFRVRTLPPVSLRLCRSSRSESLADVSLLQGLEFRARVGSEAKGSILVHGFWFLGFVFWWVCFGFWICDGLRDKYVIFIGMRIDFGYDHFYLRFSSICFIYVFVLFD